MPTLTKADQKIDGFIGDLMDYIYWRYPWSDDLPNHLMWLRLLLFPVQFTLLGAGLERQEVNLIVLAWMVLSFQAFTDLVDGYIARKHDCTSTSGARWDPFADKMMVLPAILLLISWTRSSMATEAGWWLMAGLFVVIIILESISTIWYMLNTGGKSNPWGKYKLHCQVMAVWLGMLTAMAVVDGDRRLVAMVMLPFLVASIGFAGTSLASKLWSR